MKRREASNIGLPFVLVAAFALGSALFLWGCLGAKPGATSKSEDSMPARPITAVLADHTAELMAIPGVVGTAEGERAGQPVFVILVERATPELKAKLPLAIEGYPVEIRETGTIRPLEGR